MHRQCEHCGSTNGPAQRFCGHCGAKLLAQNSHDSDLPLSGAATFLDGTPANCELSNAQVHPTAGGVGPTHQPPGSSTVALAPHSFGLPGTKVKTPAPYAYDAAFSKFDRAGKFVATWNWNAFWAGPFFFFRWGINKFGWTFVGLNVLLAVPTVLLSIPLLAVAAGVVGNWSVYLAAKKDADSVLMRADNKVFRVWLTAVISVAVIGAATGGTYYYTDYTRQAHLNGLRNAMFLAASQGDYQKAVDLGNQVNAIEPHVMDDQIAEYTAKLSPVPTTLGSGTSTSAVSPSSAVTADSSIASNGTGQAVPSSQLVKLWGNIVVGRDWVGLDMSFDESRKVPMMTIENHTDFEWDNLTITINPSGLPYRSTMSRLEPHGSDELPLSNFADASGLRFNADVVKVMQVDVKAVTNSGPGYGLWNIN